MKRCPKCRRDFTDETLNYCLDDGTTLVDGPASGEAPTAVFGERDINDGAGRSKRPVNIRTAVIFALIIAIAGAAIGSFPGRPTRGPPRHKR
jgi:hypothetical protein